jgi:lipid-binding SYLF domain-containing protein
MMALRLGFLPAVLATLGSSARAADQADVVKAATALLEEVVSNPKLGKLKQDLKDAKGVVIVPRLVKTQLGVAHERGHGVFLSRNEKGEWGNAEPFEVSGVGAGAIAGREVTERVIILRTKKTAEGYGEDHSVLSASIQFSAWWKRRGAKFHGPEGEMLQSKKDVLVYERSRGAIAGAAIHVERRWGPSWKPADKAPTPPTGPKAAEAAHGPSKPSPEVARLKAVLTAITADPPSRLAGADSKDSNVRPASGATISSPR